VVAAYQRRTRGAGTDEMQWVGVPFIRAHTERGGDGMAQARHAVHGRARTVRACMRGCRAQRGWATAGAYVEATLKGVLSIHRRRGGELDREGTRRGHVAAGVCQRTTPARLGARTVG
jgi:hypothetical protein